MAQWERNAGRGDGGLTTAEREELSRLRRENRQLAMSGRSSQGAAAWFARETNAESRRRVPVRSDRQGRLSDRHDVPRAGCLLQRLSCVGEAAAVAVVPDRTRC